MKKVFLYSTIHLSSLFMQNIAAFRILQLYFLFDCSPLLNGCNFHDVHQIECNNLHFPTVESLGFSSLTFSLGPFIPSFGYDIRSVLI